MLSGVPGVSLDHAQAQSAAERQYRFAIPSQPVPQALNAIGQAAGISVVVNGGGAGGRRSQAISGSFTAREALSAALAGTGLTYSFTNANTVTVFDPNAGAQTGIYAADGETIQLDTIEVAGNGGNAAADSPYETPGSVSHISAEQIQLVPPTSTGDMFRNVPGVISSGNRNGQSLDLNIRGLQGPNRVATLVDGAQQASSTYRGYRGMSSRTFVDPEFIGGIDIEKGPSSGPFGSGSMGGVVNMRTINADDIVMDGNTYGIRLKGGLAGNTINPPPFSFPPDSVPQRFDGNSLLDTGSGIGSAAVAAKTENFELLGAFAYRKNGNYFAGENGEKLVKRRSFGTTVYRDPMSGYKPGGEVFNTSQDTKSILLKGKAHFNDEHSLELGYIRYDSEYGEEYGDINNPFSAFGAVYQTNLSHVTSDTYTAKYNWSPLDNDLIDFHVNVWRSDVSDLWAAFEILTGFPSDADIVTTGTEVWNTSRFDASFGAFELKYGGAYSHEDVTQNPGQLMSVEGTRDIGALFANLSYKPADWLTLSGGLRYETYATEDDKAVDPVDGLEDDRLNPRVGITVEPLDGLQLFATYTEGWRPPSVRETVFVMPTQIDPNPFLRPEISKNYEFGFNYLHDSLFADGDKIRLKAAYFDNTYEDYIIREYGNRVGLPFSYRTFANIEGAKFKGVEVSLSYDMGRFFTEGSVSYYTDVEYCFAARAGEDAACVEDTPSNDYTSNYVPPKYNGSLTIGGRFLDESLTIGGRVTFAGDRAILRKSGVESNWRYYQVYDAFVNYEINENFSVNASLENVFDLYYLDALSEALSPSPGRTLRVSATARF